MKTYYNVDSGEFLTESEIRKEYKAAKASGSTFSESFSAYLSACMTENNGSLIPVTKQDLRWVEITAVYYTEGKFAPYQHTDGVYTQQVFFLKRETVNGNAVNWQGVNGVCLDLDEDRIFQASGYTRERGLFCDMY